MATARKSAAARAEVAGTPTEFAYDGVVYTVAPSRDWDLDALEAFEEGHIASAVRLILGAEQWKTFRSKPRTVGDLNDLFTEAQKAAGIEGN
ncbi:hypothetical protein [Micromonospora sp. NPDC023956]|uniref:hypothetical protein n=1 Tax=Micromonospora sp. NPDC023956 TaxID=3155722 RepID=UPI00340F6C61